MQNNQNESAAVVFAGCQWVAGGLALGIEAEMDGGLQGSKSPLVPLKGGDQRVPWPELPDIVAESPTARRLCKGYRLWVIGYRMGFFGTMVGMVLPPRRNAQIIKKMMRTFCMNYA